MVVGSWTNWKESHGSFRVSPFQPVKNSILHCNIFFATISWTNGKSLGCPINRRSFRLILSPLSWMPRLFWPCLVFFRFTTPLEISLTVKNGGPGGCYSWHSTLKWDELIVIHVSISKTSTGCFRKVDNLYNHQKSVIVLYNSYISYIHHSWGMAKIVSNAGLLKRAGLNIVPPGQTSLTHSGSVCFFRVWVVFAEAVAMFLEKDRDSDPAILVPYYSWACSCEIPHTAPGLLMEP